MKSDWRAIVEIQTESELMKICRKELFTSKLEEDSHPSTRTRAQLRTASKLYPHSPTHTR